MILFDRGAYKPARERAPRIGRSARAPRVGAVSSAGRAGSDTHFDISNPRGLSVGHYLRETPGFAA